MKKIAVIFGMLLALSIALSTGAAAADTLVLPADTTVIEAQAFYGVDAETIILPEGVTTIGDAAFGGSAALRTVYVPEALMGREEAALQGSPDAVFVSRAADWTAVYDYTAGDSGVTIDGYKGTDSRVSIPAVIEGKTVTTIGPEAFKKKTTLTKVVIPEGVTQIRYDAFDGCTALADVAFPSTLVRIEDNAFRGCGRDVGETFYYRLPDNLEFIRGIDNGSNYSFVNCDAVLVVTPDSRTARLLSTSNLQEYGRGSFTYPGEYDFRYKFFPGEDGETYDTLHLMAWAGSGTEVSIPDHGDAYTRVSVIHNSVFRGKTTLTKAVIPEGMTTIQYDAFDGCTALTDVTFPSTLVRIEDNAFRGCGHAVGETFYYRLPDNLEYIRGIDNGDNYSFVNCDAVLVVTPDSNTARLLSTSNMEDYGRGSFTYPGEYDFRYKFFRGNDSETYDTLHLMAWAGSGTEVSIPDHGDACTRVSVIHNSVFRQKTALTKVVIPEGVTKIQYDAFDGCTALTDVTFPSTLVRIEDNAFRGCGHAVGETFYYRLPDNLEFIQGVVGGDNYSFVDCDAVMVVTPDSNTARLLSTSNMDDYGRGSFTYPGELDFRYKFFPGEDGETYDTLHLMAWAGSGTEVSIPDHGDASTKVSVIHNSVFRKKSTLTIVVIPEGVTEIQYDAFDGCSMLADVTFPSTLVTIGNNAFRGCATAVEGNVFYDLPDTLASISDNAFSDCAAKLCCSRYISEEYSDTTSTYQLLGDNWWGWLDGPFRLTDYPVTFRYQSSTGEWTTGTEIRYRLAQYVAEEGPVNSLTVTIPDKVVVIDDECFKGRWDLKRVDMPDYALGTGEYTSRSVADIGARAFMDCSYLAVVNFPSVLSSLGDNAFTGCGASVGWNEFTCTVCLPNTQQIDAEDPANPFYNSNLHPIISYYDVQDPILLN